MHRGSDESNGIQWKANPRIAEFMRQHGLKDTIALQTYFNQRLQGILRKNGKHMVGWDEILTPTLPKGVVVQSWHGSRALAAAVAQGNQGVLSAPYYLNHMGTSETFYLSDPEPGSTELTPAQRKMILGGEACMWGEYVDPETIDSRIWPRTASIAERLWSPKSVRDVNDLYRRLDVAAVRLEALGLNHLTHVDEALRNLANSSDLQPLRALASIVEPDDDNSHHGSTTFTPLDYFSDAVQPDPASRRKIKGVVDLYLQDPTGHQQERDYLATGFNAWLQAAQNLQMEVQRSPGLAEVQGRATNDGTSRDWSKCADVSRIGRRRTARLATETVIDARCNGEAKCINSVCDTGTIEKDGQVRA